MSGQVESYGEAIAEEVLRKDKLRAILRNRSFGTLPELWLPMLAFLGGSVFLQKEVGGISWIFSASLATSWGLAAWALSRCRMLEKKVDALIALSELDKE